MKKKTIRLLLVAGGVVLLLWLAQMAALGHTGTDVMDSPLPTPTIDEKRYAWRQPTPTETPQTEVRGGDVLVIAAAPEPTQTPVPLLPVTGGEN